MNLMQRSNTERMALTAIGCFLLITVAAAQEDSYRLPTIAKPLRYDISLEPDFVTFTFLGNASIEIEVREETKNITLHANTLQINNYEVFDENDTILESIESDYEEQKHFLILYYNDSNAFATGNYTLKFNYTGTMDSDMYGFYRSSYITEKNEVRWIAATHFQPTHARRAFPCFDEPNFKAKFHISINTPPSYHSLSNMPINSIWNSTEGWKMYDFEETGVMSTYLVAFVVSDFENLTNSNNRYQFSAWARPQAIAQAEYSQEVGVKVVDFYEEFTAIPYSFPKIDQVALPDFSAGAMENWGLITYREAGLLYDEKESTTANKKSTALVVAHELAHMWFGNLVTVDWWSESWLNEGFARYFQYVSIEKIYPTWHIMDQFVVDQLQSIFGSDALTTAQALTSDCNTPAEISAKFGSITYSKGASVIRMLSHVLTQKTFQKGIQQYLTERSWKNSLPDDLFSALEAQRIADGKGDVTVMQFFIKWTTQPGFPVLTVTRNYVNKEITVSQRQFLLNMTEESDQTWWVPLTWTVASQGSNGFVVTEPLQWMRDEKVILTEVEAQDDEWIIFNNQQTGYYRVNYDRENWELITKALHLNHSSIHILNRAQLIDDSMNLARAGLLSYTTALKLTSYLKNEEEYFPWAAGFNGFSFVERRIGEGEDYEIVRKYLLYLVEDLYQNLKNQEVNDDSNQMLIFNRANAISWACHLKNEDCVNDAKNKFMLWGDPKDSSPVPANIRSSVYCTAVAQGQQYWDFLWSRYNITKMAAERVLILSALGCTSNRELLKEYLGYSIRNDSGIRKQDAASVFSAVYNNPVGVPVALEFLKRNYEAISKYYGGMNALGKSITGIASRLTTDAQVTELETFINENREALKAVAEAATNALETARANLEWSATYKDTIVTWMKENTPSSASRAGLTVTTVLIAIFYFM